MHGPVTQPPRTPQEAALHPEPGGVALDGPRPAQGDEWLEAARLADLVFSAETGRPYDMATMFPLLFSPENAAHLRVFSARQPGKAGDRERLVSHLGIRVVEVSLYGHRLAVGCIGAVVTHPEWRGRGLASRLLDDAFRLLREEGVPVAWISGDRGLYLRHGCQKVGRVHVFEVPPGAAGQESGQLHELRLQPPAHPGTGEPAFDSGLFSQLIDLYHREPVRFVRPADTFATLLGAAGYARASGTVARVFLAGEPPVAAWIVAVPPDPARSGRPARVMEATGSRPALVASAPRVAAAVGAPLVWVVLPWDREALALLRRRGWPERVQPQYGTLRVLDGQRLLEVLRPYLVERLGRQRAEALRWPHQGAAAPGAALSPEAWVWGAPPASPDPEAGRAGGAGTAVEDGHPSLPEGAFPLPWPWAAGLDYT